jgi:hypothetical protein
MLTILTLFAP